MSKWKHPNNLVLTQVDPNHPVWREAVSDITSSGWRLGSVVSLSQWVPGLARRAMPPILRAAITSASTLDLTHDSRVTQQQLRDSNVTQQQQQQLLLRDLSVSEAAELAQWSDLVIFDYITGNYDRVASMMVMMVVMMVVIWWGQNITGQTLQTFSPLPVDIAHSSCLMFVV